MKQYQIYSDILYYKKKYISLESKSYTSICNNHIIYNTYF